MREHWEAGLADIRRTLKHPEWLERPRGLGVVTHDVHRPERHATKSTTHDADHPSGQDAAE